MWMRSEEASLIMTISNTTIKDDLTYCCIHCCRMDTHHMYLGYQDSWSGHEV